MSEGSSYRQASPVPPTKAELLAALRACAEEFIAGVMGLPAESFEEGRYENGWNGRQILAHVAAIEWTYPNLIQIAREAAAAQPNEGPASGSIEGGIDAYNARQVAKRQDVPVVELLAEFRRNRATTIAAVEAVPEALLAVPIRSAGGIPGPLGSVMMAVAVGHVRQHLGDIVGEG